MGQAKLAKWVKFKLALTQQPASRIHSRYTRKVTDLCCAGRRVELFLHVRKFFCQTGSCSRKIFCERLSPFIEPWARLTSRLSGVIEAVGLGTCGRLGVRLCHRLGIATSRMSILRRLMKLATPDSGTVTCLGIDDFAFRRGRTFGTVLVDLEHHEVIDLLPDRQVQTATCWMQKHPEIRYVSRDRGSEYAAAASAGAPQAVQVADRYHIKQNLTEAVQLLLSCVLTESKNSQQKGADDLQQQAERLSEIEEWRPAQGKHVNQAIGTRRAERQDRYQQVMNLREQGLTAKQVAGRLGMTERTVRRWLQQGAAPETRPRRKYPSDFDPYAPYVLKRWQEGCHNGRQVWQEIAAQGYPGSSRMVYRFLETAQDG